MLININAPNIISAMPALNETYFIFGNTFSTSTNKAITAIDNKFIIPLTNNKAINIQQRPRQYIPFSGALFSIAELLGWQLFSKNKTLPATS